GRCAHAPFGNECVEKFFNLGRPEFARVSPPVAKQITTNPAEIGSLRPTAVMPRPELVAHALEHALSLRLGARRSRLRHGNHSARIGCRLPLVARRTGMTDPLTAHATRQGSRERSIQCHSSTSN